jgi:nitric oxide reductase activation protein
MGAAIRHAATQFAQSEARVRLLIILGDGFPNDLNYKKEYAVEDTRKAIAELRGRHIHVHAITVNLQTNGISKLDEIYGDIHHTVIVNVSELPDKLLRIYGKLTQR